jgi:hypothetical protein
MATLSANALTLADWAKRLDPKGKIPYIVEMLSQTNQILDDMLWMQGNLPTGHRTTIRTGLPTVYWKLLNQGTQPSKSTTAQIDESCGMLEAWSECDAKLAELGGNVNAFRLSEARPFLEAMSQEMASTLFYGNSSTDPEEFNGLAVRYSDLSAANAQNIIDASGTQSDNMSIWLIVWGEQGCFGVFPQGSQAGIEHENLGKVTVETTAGVAGSRMRAYQDHWMWDAGLVLKDWRQAVRICNIDVSNLVAQSSQADLTNAMIKAMHRVKNIQAGRACFYMNRSALQYLDIERRADVISGGGLNYDNIDGKLHYSFRGVPIKICDALLETEARVT